MQGSRERKNKTLRRGLNYRRLPQQDSGYRIRYRDVDLLVGRIAGPTSPAIKGSGLITLIDCC